MSIYVIPVYCPGSKKEKFKGENHIRPKCENYGHWKVWVLQYSATMLQYFSFNPTKPMDGPNPCPSLGWPVARYKCFCCTALYCIMSVSSFRARSPSPHIACVPPLQKTIRGVGALHCFCPLHGDAIVVQRNLRSEGNCLSRGWFSSFLPSRLFVTDGLAYRDSRAPR